MAMAFLVPLAVVALLAAAITWLWDYTFMLLVWRPYAIGKKLRRQGIHGPTYKVVKGCKEDIKTMKEETDGLVLDVHDHNYLPRIAPHYLKWRAQYGEPFLYWFGPKPRICIFDYELARQILSSKSGHFVKNDPPATLLDVVGNGLALLDGVDWMMTTTMLACAQSMINELENQTFQNKNGEIEVDLNIQFRELAADVISHAAFGSSYKLGKQVFQIQHDLMAINVASALDVQIPGLRYLPTERNRRRRMLEKKLRSSLMQIIQPRLASTSRDYGDDLLGLMLESCNETKQGGEEGGLGMSIDEIIHECKMFYFAGHDTMTMVVLETLRLYCPPLFMQRKPIVDITVGGMKLPKGVAVVIPIPIMHREEEVWGDDAGEFNPLRFENGVTRAAKVPHAMLGFAMGPRSCIGQNFAMLEAKSALAVMLQKFSFTLSPDYVHAPTDIFMLKPKFGLPVILRRLG
ncbi:hypothetical protein HU200_023320 [Digitaria exilis]|uniref:Cytochrome P450 n=1 Tax=Digitaria exilis TaxID=1010633 RepID=A0A835EXK3_9POAL|nr:hypothetical protein HU200_023320 [Digitaria exilis]